MNARLAQKIFTLLFQQIIPYPTYLPSITILRISIEAGEEGKQRNEDDDDIDEHAVFF